MKIGQIIKSLIFITGVLLFNVSVFSQEITAKAELDTNMILIGDQITFSLELNQPTFMTIAFPDFLDTLIKNVEILERSKIDTTYITNSQILLKQNFRLTCFDSGSYVIPPLAFAFELNGQKDTLYSRPLWLGVNTFQIDSVKGIIDIKPPINTPFTFDEFIDRFAFPIGLAIVALGLIIFLIYYFKKKNKAKPVAKRVKPKKPAHIIALDSLDKLKNKKLWQHNKVKQYYSELTEIIRIFIEHRFDLMAMEETSDEILEGLEQLKLIEQNSFDELRNILELSDLVKFAKHLPLANEHELCLQKSYDFVLKNKQTVNLMEKKEDTNEILKN